jgi:CBS-domain-containing membrane protein
MKMNRASAPLKRDPEDVADVGFHSPDRMQMNIGAFFRSFMPHVASVHFAEKWRSGLAGGVAILLLALLLHNLPHEQYPLVLLASMAASAVLLFAVPHSPFSQPWNLVAGHAVSALAGWTSYLLIGPPLLAAGVAVGMAIFLMYALNCLHPPGAATALTLVLGAAQFQPMGGHWVTLIVVVNAGILLLLALLINNMLPHRRYPMAAGAPARPRAARPVLPEQQDIQWSLDQMDSMIDVSIEDLTAIYASAQERAQTRFESKLK